MIDKRKIAELGERFFGGSTSQHLSQMLMAFLCTMVAFAMASGIAIAVSEFGRTIEEQSSGSVESSVDDWEAEPEEALPLPLAYLAVPSSASCIPASNAPEFFSADGGEWNGGQAPEEIISAISESISGIESSGCEAGFVLVNLGNGHGLACNADSRVYGASTIKAIVSAYALSTITDDTPEWEVDSIHYLVEPTVVDSNNETFFSLYTRYGNGEYREWLESIGVTENIHQGQSFTWYTPREAVRMWLALSRFLASGNEQAEWLAELLGETNLSFIRNAISEETVEEYEEGDGLVMVCYAPNGITMMNKAGWYGSYAGDPCASVSDNAIIEEGDDRYLLCVMTSLPYFQYGSVEKAEGLIENIWQARSYLR